MAFPWMAFLASPLEEQIRFAVPTLMRSVKFWHSDNKADETSYTGNCAIKASEALLYSSTASLEKSRADASITKAQISAP